MKLSTKCRYGARAIIEIAMNYNKGPVKRKTIVENQEISDSYLENILISLKNNGIIYTTRGPKGGYILSRSPSEITFYDIVKSLNGSLSPVDCLDSPDLCNRSDNCSTRDVWGRMEQAQADVLKSVTVQELIDKENKAKFG